MTDQILKAVKGGHYVADGAKQFANNGHGDTGQFEGSSPAPLPLTPAEDRRWAMIAHFGSILGFIPSLAIYLVYRGRGPFTAQESKEAFNFTFPLTVIAVVANLLALIPGIGWVFSILVVLIWLTLTVGGLVGGMQVNKGRPYRYPLNLRLFK